MLAEVSCITLSRQKRGYITTLYDKIVIENKKKKKIWKSKSNIYINLHLKDSLGMEFTAC